jgi:hypothetical protein
MRVAAKADDNQAETVRALRRVGASVQTLHRVGCGCPDLLVGYRGRNFLLEIKDGRKSPSRRALTKDQELFHALWRGEIAIVRSVSEALRAIGAIGD